MPDPLDNFGEAYRELLDATDLVVDEIAARVLRGPPTGQRLQRQRILDGTQVPRFSPNISPVTFDEPTGKS